MGEARDRAPSLVDGPPGPVRTCVGCRARTTATELLRIVVQNGAIVPDPAHRLPGRGAYLHHDLRCFDTAVRRKAMTRALKLTAPLPDSAVQAHLVEMIPHQAVSDRSVTTK